MQGPTHPSLAMPSAPDPLVRGGAPRLRGSRARPVAAKERKSGICSPSPLSGRSGLLHRLPSAVCRAATRRRLSVRGPCRTHCKGRASCTFPWPPRRSPRASPQAGLPAPRALAVGKGLLAWLLACPSAPAARARRFPAGPGSASLPTFCQAGLLQARPAGPSALLPGSHRLQTRPLGVSAPPACAALGTPRLCLGPVPFLRPLRLPRPSHRATGD